MCVCVFFFFWVLIGHCSCSQGLSFSGREFDEMNEEEQREACRNARLAGFGSGLSIARSWFWALFVILSRLFSRVEPAHKSKIVGYLQDDGAVSAMVSKGKYDNDPLVWSLSVLDALDNSNVAYMHCQWKKYYGNTIICYLLIVPNI